ncbi:hypothetical protein ANO14919_035180 [Xylariales sp. No.14919]|nr:hypothetical protein ANO14919_035180 [Xylariales sp. No.14919]
MASTWFLLPDFTFTIDGPLRLGMVIPHWSQPTTVLATVGRGTAGNIELPPQITILEPNHAHSRSQSQSTGLSMWSTFEGLASALLGIDFGGKNKINYSETNHEIHSFKDPLTPETVAAIANLPAVRAHIDSGLFGKRPAYIVSGLRIATSSFTVMKERSNDVLMEAVASGPPAEMLPDEIGGKARYDSKKTVTDSYETAPGIVFAYRLHILRTVRAGMETGLFSHKSAFLTGAAGEAQESLILAEATQDEINKDLEEDVKYERVDTAGDEVCIIFNESYDTAR